MKLTATVVWSVGINLDLPDNATDEEQREAIYNAAIHAHQGHPIIHECSNENLID